MPRPKKLVAAVPPESAVPAPPQPSAGALPAAKTRKAAATLSGPQALNQAVWQICDVLRRAGVGSALRYMPELTWILFLRVLDEQEMQERDEADALGLDYTPSLPMPWRWQDWAAPWSDADSHPRTPEGLPQGWKRRELTEAKRGDYFA